MDSLATSYQKTLEKKLDGAKALAEWGPGRFVTTNASGLIVENPCVFNGKKFCYRPLGRIGSKTIRLDGLPFSSSLEKYIADLPENSNLSIEKASDRELLEKLTIVTYASENHFDEVKMMLITWRRSQPTVRIVFFSMGLQDTQMKELQTLCNVTVRRLDFDKYPPHVKNFRNYAFKIAVMRESYLEFPFFFIMDTSLRPTVPADFLSFLRASAKKEIHPFAMTHPTNRSNSELTHFGMYAYLDIVKTLNNRRQFEAGSVLIRQDPYSAEILKWAILCAFTKECIDPLERRCNVTRGISSCHQYDQSMLNILTYNALQEFPQWESKVSHWPHDKANKVRRDELWIGDLPKEILCI
ncbi:unnamed protein product, partial [Mesorhabditis belari]|uniref:Uncharacterized protein n=1 Tax=Mesorhabditis belari TaxID=2138241 RepID=A0AAF3ELR7_9BILA